MEVLFMFYFMAVSPRTYNKQNKRYSNNKIMIPTHYIVRLLII